MPDNETWEGLRPVVVICTRDRPDDLSRCLASLLAPPQGCQVIIVDQSQGTETALVVKELAGHDDRVVYVSSQRTGLSVARNEGAALADGELLLFTDDDCEVAGDWVRSWWRVFHGDPTLGIGFGQVTTPPFDPRSGHIPHFDPGALPKSWGLELFRLGAGSVGMGANMALRRDAWIRTGGFDERLGAGATFPAAEEIDLAFRVIRNGRVRIAHAQGPTVVHYGFRETSAASRLGQGYAAATAAMYVKHVRCRDRRAAVLLVEETARLTARVTRSVLTGTRPTGFNSLRAFLRGMAGSRDCAIDAPRRMYCSAGGSE